MDTVRCRDCDKADCPARDKVRAIYPCDDEEYRNRLKKKFPRDFALAEKELKSRPDLGGGNSWEITARKPRGKA